MKIRKIDIQAFRLFDDETVSFTCKQDAAKPANFVAIYAPNGFGKTSFFDAMEFCMTGKIHRLMENLSENVAVDRIQAKGKSFIHNKDFPARNVSVKMEFDGHDPVLRTCRPDQEYSLLQGNEENSYFTEAILSQDFFSSFISDKDSKQRFEIFTKRFKQTSGLLTYLQWLKTEKNSLSRQISIIAQQIRSKNELIDRDIESVDLKVVTQEIVDKLQLFGYDINYESSLSEKRLNSLRIQVSSWIEECNHVFAKLDERLSKLANLKHGTETICSISELSSIEKQIKNGEEELKALKKQIDQINRYKELKEQIAKVAYSVNNLEQEIRRFSYLIDHFNECNKIDQSIRSIESKIKQEKALIVLLYEKRTNIDNNLSIERSKIHRVEESLLKQDELLSSLSQRYDQMRMINQSIEESRKQLDLAKIDKDNREKEIKKLNESSQELHILLDSLYRRNVDLSSSLFYEERRRLFDTTNQIAVKRKELEDLQISINEKNKYRGEIEQLVLNSRALLSKFKGAVCPLCGFNYHSHETLLQKISSNTIVNDLISKDLQRINDIGFEINNLSTSIDHQYITLIKTVEGILKSNEEKVKDESLFCSSLSEQSLHLLKIIDEKETILKQKYFDISHLSEEKARQLLVNQKQRLSHNRTEILRKIDAFDKELKNINKQVEEKNQYIESLSKDMFHEALNDVYQLFAAYKSLHNLVTIDKEELTNQKQRFELDLEKQQRSLSSYNQEIDSLTVRLEQEESIISSKNKLDTKIKYYVSVRSKIYSYLKNECGIKDLQLSVEGSVVEEFNKQYDNQYKKVCQVEEKLVTLNRYLCILDLVVKVYSNQRIKDDIMSLEEQCQKLKQNQKECVVEIKGIEQYLTTFVEDYFELNLINQLYNAIDPHPDYKQIRFDCDFKNKLPRLRILLNSFDGGKDSIVPNLYLSTAQINILSFCIFLAKALFVKDERGNSLDCLFIDDPIQALDDINILTIIDLLRNIAFTMDKQIIITTHNRNFFELLKKKVPDNLFKARYLTIYERGKFQTV